ncbi:hypothetical protein [Hymenobacter sp. UYP22]|uniref:hypothetical protein n=1 Tax=Hymenobacter sp. UYP22 TaxID=3156348 RepID=UPI00339949B7
MLAYFGKSLFLAGLVLLLLGAAPDTFCQVATQKYLPGQIAAIKTDAQVLELIRPFGWEFEEAVLGDSAVAAYRPYRSTRFAVRGSQTWFKADFDHNGLPDLLVLARRRNIPFLFCVLDKGDKFQIERNFANGVRRRRHPVARVVHRNSQDLLEYADFAGRVPGGQERLRNRRSMLLAYVSGGFVEYNAHPIQRQVKEVTYESSSFYQRTTHTSIIVKGDSIKFWQRYTERSDSTQVTQIEHKRLLLPAQRQQLIQLLSYLNYSTLKGTYGSYSINHSTHVRLTIENDSGAKKQIDDINGVGTWGLRQLYILLHELGRP